MSAIIQERPVTPDVLRFLDTDLPAIARDGVLVGLRSATTDQCGGTIPADSQVARLTGNPWRPRS